MQVLERGRHFTRRVNGAAQQTIPKPLGHRLRAQVQDLGVSVASLCHLAWAQIVARSSGSDGRVVFGTMLPVAEPLTRIMPMRVDLEGLGVEACARQVHRRLADLSRHASLPLESIQRCSGVEPPALLFTALLYYRNDADATRSDDWPEERQPAGYPFTISVADSGQTLELVARIQ